MKEQLTSVGIDIGTSTTQLVVSTLTLENRASPFTVPRVAITEREIVYRSAIHFTPLLSDTVIDADGVRAIVAEEYRKAGLRREEVETGAVIITGETARKENAREVLAALSEFAGDFVVATAGPDLESILAARGAGADEYSREHRCKVLHFDIGGGTADIAVISLSGVVESASIKIAGDQLNESVVKYMRRKHNLLVGERTAEEMKKQIGCVFPKDEEETMDVKGRCLLTVAGCLLWTPIRYETLYGLQGRYFLPILPLLLLACLPRRLATVPDEGAAQDKLTIAIALVQAGVVVNSMLAVIAR